MTSHWHDFKIVQVTESRISRLDVTNSAHATTQLKDTSFHRWLQQQSVNDVKIVQYWQLNSHRKKGPKNQRGGYAEAIRIKERLYEGSGEGTQKCI